MGVDNSRPWEHPEINQSSAPRYVLGYVVTLALCTVSLLLVQQHAMSAFNLLSAISCVALLTTIAKLVLLFHLNFSETQRWNTLTLMLNVPLLILSVGLSSWMFSVLYQRVMMH